QPEAVPSAGLTARIMAALPESDAAPRSAPAWAPALGLALAAALVAVAGYMTVSMHPPASGEGVMAAGASDAAEWLVAQQEADGSWRPSRTGGHDAYQPAVTALALLALQCQSPDKHAAAIARGTQALLAMQAPDGSFGKAAGAKQYNHAIATYALLSLVQRPDVPSNGRAALDRAIAFTRGTQNSGGGWDYSLDGPGNTALSVWQLGVLAQAAAQGWGDADGHLRRGLAWLRGQARGDGHFGYRQPGVPSPGCDGLTLTAMAAATLLSAARQYPELTQVAQTSIGALRRQGGAAPNATPDYYRDYFVSRAFALAADRAAAAGIARTVAARRQRDSVVRTYWSANDRWGATGGDLYATAMAMLTGGPA
ncbi:MAG: terpene cyclase/mutase family protein, partial [Kiritimatiellae bacterium]|nr:terpene cyclase/mutase family protein [Kiritimatiellia bacterium]